MYLYSLLAHTKGGGFFLSHRQAAIDEPRAPRSLFSRLVVSSVLSVSVVCEVHGVCVFELRLDSRMPTHTYR